MSYFLWDDKYAFGIDSIDEDHKVLVSLINQLYVAMSQGKARAVISGIVTQMVDYAKVHFRREEFFLKGLATLNRQSIKPSTMRSLIGLLILKLNLMLVM